MERTIFEGDKVTMMKRTYDAIQDKLLWLECLEQAGVDNWAGYTYARDLKREYEENEE